MVQETPFFTNNASFLIVYRKQNSVKNDTPLNHFEIDAFLLLSKFCFLCFRVL